MKPTTSRKAIIVEIAALVVLALFFFVSVQRGSESVDTFVPPVYGTDENEQFITLPFFLEGTSSNNGLSEEQKQHVNGFRKHILARTTSAIPLRETEIDIILVSISTTTK